MKYTLLLLLFPLMIFAQDSTLIGDVDCSGEVNSQDASLILQFVTNVIDELPCEANMTGLTPDQLQEMIDMMEDQLSINYNTACANFGDIISIVLEQSVDNPSETNFFQVENDGFLVVKNPQSAYYFSIFFGPDLNNLSWATYQLSLIHISEPTRPY